MGRRRLRVGPCDNRDVSSTEQPALPDPSDRPAIPVEAPNEILLEEATTKVHRAPRYTNFMLLGAIVGVICALVLTFAFPENPVYDRGQVFGFLVLACIAIGVALGCVFALVLDRILSKKAATVVIDRVGTQPPVVPTHDAASDSPVFNEKSE